MAATPASLAPELNLHEPQTPLASLTLTSPTSFSSPLSTPLTQQAPSSWSPHWRKHSFQLSGTKIVQELSEKSDLVRREVLHTQTPLHHYLSAFPPFLHCPSHLTITTRSSTHHLSPLHPVTLPHPQASPPKPSQPSPFNLHNSQPCVTPPRLLKLSTSLDPQTTHSHVISHLSCHSSLQSLIPLTSSSIDEVHVPKPLHPRNIPSFFFFLFSTQLTPWSHSLPLPRPRLSPPRIS